MTNEAGIGLMETVRIVNGKHQNKIAKVEKISNLICCKVPLKVGYCFLWYRAEEVEEVDPILYHEDSDRWNPKHFGDAPRKIEPSGQLSIFFDDSYEPPDPDDYPSIGAYLKAWDTWEQGDEMTAGLPESIE